MKYTILILLVAAHFNYMAEKKERSLSLSDKQSVMKNHTAGKNALFSDSSSPSSNVLNDKQCNDSRLRISEHSDNLVSFVRNAVQLR